MPCNAIVKIKQNKRQQCGTCCSKWRPTLSVDITKIGKPASRSVRFQLAFAVVWPKGRTVGITASKGRLDVLWDFQTLDFDVGETNVLYNRPKYDGGADGKVTEGVSDRLVAKVSRLFESTQSKNRSSRSKADNDTQKGRF